MGHEARESKHHLFEDKLLLIHILRLSQVRGVVDSSGYVANVTVSIEVPVLGSINVADLGANLQDVSATASFDVMIAKGYAMVSVSGTDVYLEVSVTSPFGNVDFPKTKIFSIW